MKSQIAKIGFVILCLAVARQVANADNKSTKSGKPEQISFADLIIGMEPDMVFRPFMLDVNPRVKEVAGERVTIKGYMSKGVTQSTKIKKFVLLKNTKCKFGPGGQADHLVYVKFKDGATAKYTDKVVEVTGTLVVNPFIGVDGNTWSIYDLKGESFKIGPR